MKNKQQEAAIKKLFGAVQAAEKKAFRLSKKKPAVKRSASETEALLASATERFFDYTQLIAPDFYKPERTYLVTLCKEMQDFLNDPDKEVLIINIPPRHGKSRTATLFAQWVFGVDPSCKIMTASYNEMLSTVFSKSVRDKMQEEKLDFDRIIYADIFPDTKIKQGDAAAQHWAIEGEYTNYLATSPSGSATGFGCDLMIIDDIVKNAYEANNEAILENHWEWFVNTMLSRLEEGGKIILIMTRWASKDLAGRAIEEYGDSAKIISMKAVQDDGSMLCKEVLSKKSYERKTKLMAPEIAAANYQQEPIDAKGRLYQSFKTYDHLPTDAKGGSLIEVIRNYADTADEGSDYLCSLVYGVYNGEAYMLDVLYTKAPMQVTEKQTAKMLYENEVNEAVFESNNGGKGYAREVERQLRDNYRSNRTVIRWFHQSRNKKARILSNASWVEEHIYFPSNWHIRWPEYYKAMTTYQREGKNANDDAPDATTGIAENMAGGGGVSVLKPRNAR